MESEIRAQLDDFNAALSKANSLYGKWAKKHGLNYNSMMVLYAMEDVEHCTQKHICEKWLLPKTTVCTILSDYQKKGYVTFLPDPNDKREKIIKLTETGQAFSDAILTKLHAAEIRAMEKMGPALRAQLVDANMAFNDAFEYEVEHE